MEVTNNAEDPRLQRCVAEFASLTDHLRPSLCMNWADSPTHEIDNVKQDAAATRIERLAKDLALLKAQDEAQYVRLRDALREALK